MIYNIQADLELLVTADKYGSPNICKLLVNFIFWNNCLGWITLLFIIIIFRKLDVVTLCVFVLDLISVIMFLLNSSV